MTAGTHKLDETDGMTMRQAEAGLSEMVLADPLVSPGFRS